MYNEPLRPGMTYTAKFAPIRKDEPPIVAQFYVTRGYMGRLNRILKFTGKLTDSSNAHVTARLCLGFFDVIEKRPTLDLNCG